MKVVTRSVSFRVQFNPRRAVHAMLAAACAILLGLAVGTVGADAQDFLGKFGDSTGNGGEFIDAEGVTVAPDGTVYVTDIGRQRVFAFDQEGTLLTSQGDTNLAPGGLTLPGDVAVGGDGRVYVVDRGEERVFIYDENLNPLDHFGSLCVAPTLPGDGCVDPDGAGPLAVGDGQFNNPNAIAYDAANDRIIVTDDGNDRVQVFDADGNFVDKFGSQGAGNGQFNVPSGVAATPGGDIVVVDGANDRIQVFDDNGGFQFAFGSQGADDGEFEMATGVDVDAGGRIYVVEDANHRVQIFEADGTHVSTFGSECHLLTGSGVCTDPDDGGPLDEGDGQFFRPRSIAVDSLGQIFVMDTNNHRVQIFGLDSDGDSFPDLWETAGIDVNGDGDVDFNMAALGADPMRKNIFVEVDYMTDHLPMPAAIADVVAAFAAAPVDNPDGTTGITLRVDIDDEIPHVDTLDLWDDFDPIKADWFGTEQERADFAAVLAAKRLVYRYALFIHDRTPVPGSSGRAERGGNDFLVSLGNSSWAADASGHSVGSRTDQSTTFMHELGHTLDLGHGGQDNVNCKPNYLSVMNYSFQPELIPEPGAPVDRLDFSRENLPVLNETQLFEPAGIGSSSGLSTRWTPDNGATTLVGPANGPLNWDNLPPNPDLSTVPVDINNFQIRECGLDNMGNNNTQVDTMMAGSDDWQNLDYNFRDDNDFADGVHNVDEEEAEMTPEIAEFFRRCAANSTEPRCLRRRHEYAAKFICGRAEDPEAPRLTPGQYTTAINIHNPFDREVTVYAKLALTYPPEEMLPGDVLRVTRQVLRYDEAFAIDCADVREAVFPDGWPTPYVKGFLVVQAATGLDVTGVYTTATLGDAGSAGTHSSIDLETVPERIVTRRPDRKADLVIDRRVAVDATCQGFGALLKCEVAIRYTVRNIGDAAAGPFSVLFERPSDGAELAVVAMPSGLAAGDSVTDTVSMEFAQPPGRPESRRICIRADQPANEVAENNEANNDRCIDF